MKSNLKSIVAVSLLVATGMMYSCKKDIKTQETVSGNETTPRAVLSTFTYNWDDRTDDTQYTSANYSSNFGNNLLGGWNANRTYIRTKSLRVKLERGYDNNNINEIQGGYGLIARTEITPAEEYDLFYDFYFADDFKWGLGGKLGWGFVIGQDNGWACQTPLDGKRGSVRMMWNDNGSGGAVLKPYVYYKSMTTECGNMAGGNSYTLAKGTWYTVYIHAKSNTSNLEDGYLKVSVKKRSDANWTDLVVNNNMKWTATTYNPDRQITKLMFDTFRGGNNEDWEADAAGYITYDNFKLKKY